MFSVSRAGLLKIFAVSRLECLKRRMVATISGKNKKDLNRLLMA